MALGTLLVGAFLFLFLIFLVIYVFTAWALMSIAQRTNTENAWLAWIPIAQLYLMTQIGQVPWWTILFLLLGFIPYVGIVVFLVLPTYWWWHIAEKRGKAGWWGLLTLIPLVNFVIIGILAWGE